MFITTKALVLRSVVYKESSRILTVLTADHGKLTVSARGAVRKNSRVAASVQPFALSDITLSKTRDRYVLTEAHVIEQFSELQNDLERMSLGAYFLELLEAVSDEDSPNPEVLSLGLNALHVLCRTKNIRPAALVKSAFELRLMCLAGYAPITDACSACGRLIEESSQLDLTGGVVYCADCSADGDDTAPLCFDALTALRYICSCESAKLYSFMLNPEPQRRLSNAAEGYILAQLDRRFGSLEYYHKIKESFK